MTEPVQTIPADVKQLLEQIKAGKFEDLQIALTRKEMREINLPSIIAERLPEGSRLEVTNMHIYELGERSSFVGLRFTMPLGPKRAAITFE